MYYLVAAVIVSSLVYWILQARDDEKAVVEGRQPASTANRVMLFFFLLIVSTCLCFFIGNAFKSDQTVQGGDADVADVPLQPHYKTQMIKNINEDVMTGLPPFSTSVYE